MNVFLVCARPGIQIWIRYMHNPKYFGHLMQRTDSLEKTLMLGKIEGRRRRGRQRMRWLNGITEQALGFGKPGVLQSMGLQRVGQDWATELTELNWKIPEARQQRNHFPQDKIKYNVGNSLNKVCINWHDRSAGGASKSEKAAQSR